MIYKFNISVNGVKTVIEGCNQIAAIGRAYRDFINNEKSKNNDKLTLEIVSERASEVVVEPKKEVEVDNAQKVIDESTVVLNPGEEAK